MRGPTRTIASLHGVGPLCPDCGLRTVRVGYQFACQECGQLLPTVDLLEQKLLAAYRRAIEAAPDDNWINSFDQGGDAIDEYS